MKINAQIYLNRRTCVLPGSEVVCRDPKQRRIIAWGDVVDVLSGWGKRMMFEVPQGIIQYSVTKREVIERIATDDYQMVFVNGDHSNVTSALFAINHAVEPLIVTQDDDGILMVKSTTQDGYVEITVELRY